MQTEYEAAVAAVCSKSPWDGGYDGYDEWRPRKDRRSELVRNFGFAIPNEEALGVIAKHAPILEIGSGTGYWAYELRRHDVRILATDPRPGRAYGFTGMRTKVHEMGWRRAMRGRRWRTLLICWPCYNRPWAAEALAFHKGEWAIYIGEGPGGCTGDDSFHRILMQRYEQEDEVEIPRWHGIRDTLTVWRRK